jgi:HK97 family phage prohead protease
MSEIERKQLSFQELNDSGEFVAVFSLFNTVDRDGDITLPTAIKDGISVPISYWGHRHTDLPVGSGTIVNDGATAKVVGKFFLDTEGGAETYKVVRNLGELQQWSYGYIVRKSSFQTIDGTRVRVLEDLDIIEVSPVLAAAQPLTHTVAIKSAEFETPEELKKFRAVLLKRALAHGGNHV